jgi:RNA polymerase sigma-70 factor (ECF subfamily)
MDDPEAAALRGLYKQHGAALWRYALLLTGDPSRAADVVQETMQRAWRHPENADTPARSARGWLFAVARELIIEQCSARFWHDTEAHGSRLPERAGTDEVNAALDTLLLGDALARLSPGDRAMVRCAYYHGCTTTKIAADLHIAEGTVKSRLHQAVHALSLQLREMGATSVRRP